MEQFDRLIKLISEDNLNKLKNSHILLVGLGGVGGMAFEVLVRMGIGKITVIDKDKFELSNLNRQVLATYDNINLYKTDCAINRAQKINKHCMVIKKDTFLTKDNIKDILIDKYDYIIDACDTVTTKLELVLYAKEHNINIISCMGTGNRINPTKLVINDIYKTNNDPLAKIMRKLLKQNNIKKLKVVYSEELPIKTNDVIASCTMVPNVAGIYLAYQVINDIIKSTN